MSAMRRLLRASGGSAAVEFALMSFFFFGTVTVALDFGIYAQQKLNLGSAVAQGAVLAFNTRDTISATNIATFVQTSAGLAAPPEVTCNINSTCLPAASRGATDYRCIDQATGAVGTTAYAVGASCAGGGTAGYYLKIVASKTYSPVAVPDKWLGGTTMAQTAVVRLQ